MKIFVQWFIAKFDVDYQDKIYCHCETLVNKFNYDHRSLTNESCEVHLTNIHISRSPN